MMIPLAFPTKFEHLTNLSDAARAYAVCVLTHADTAHLSIAHALRIAHAAETERAALTLEQAMMDVMDAGTGSE